MSRSLALIEIRFVVSQKGLQQVTQDVRKGVGDIVPPGTQQQLKGLDASFRGLAGAFTSFLVARRGAQVLGAMIKPALDLDLALQELRGISHGLGVEFDVLRHAAERAAAATTFSPAETVAGMRQFIAQTRDAATALDIITPAAKLAQASFGRLGMADAMQIAAVAARGFHFEGLALGKSIEKLFHATAEMGLPMEGLVKGFSVLQQATALGAHDFNDLLIAFSAAGFAMNSPRRAAQGLLSTLQKLAKVETQLQFEELFGASINAADGIDLMREVILPLHNSLKEFGGTLSEADLRNRLVQVFGQRDIKSILSGLKLLEGGIKGVNGESLKGATALDVLNQRLNDNDTLNRLVGASMAAVRNAWGQTKEAITIFLAEAGGPVLEWLRTAAQLTAGIVMGIVDMGRAVPIIGLFHKGVFALVFAAGIAKVAMFGLAGVTRIVGATAQFARTSIAGLGAAGTISARTVGFLAGQEAAAAVGAVALGKAMQAAALGVAAVGTTSKFAWRALLGPIGLLLVLAEVAAGVWMMLRGSDKIVGTGSGKAAKNARGIAGSITGAGEDFADSIEEVSGDLDKAALQLDKAAEKLQKATETPFPFIDERVFIKLQRAAAARVGMLPAGGSAAKQVRGAELALSRMRELLFQKKGPIKAAEMVELRQLAGGVAGALGKAGFGFGPTAELFKTFREDIPLALKQAGSPEARLLLQMTGPMEDLGADLATATQAALQIGNIIDPEDTVTDALEALREELQLNTEGVRNLRRAISARGWRGEGGVQVAIDGEKLEVAQARVRARRALGALGTGAGTSGGRGGPGETAVE